jgi:hypothetical protein
MILNFSQQASKKTPGHLSVSALAVERVLEYAVRQYAQTGEMPSKRSISLAIGYNYQGVCKAWTILTQANRLPEYLKKPERRSKEPTCHLHTGAITGPGPKETTPETRENLKKLFRSDPEAVIHRLCQLLEGMPDARILLTANCAGDQGQLSQES